MTWTKFAYLMFSIEIAVLVCISNDLEKAILLVGIGIWVLLVALLVEG